MEPYDALINELALEEYNAYHNPFSLKTSPSGQHLLTTTPEEQIKFALAATHWLIYASPKPPFRGKNVGDMTPSDVVRAAVFSILRRRLPTTNDDVNGLLDLSLIHISEPTRQAEISYAVFCLKTKSLPRYKRRLSVCSC